MKYFILYIALILGTGFNCTQSEQSKAAACAEYAALKSGEAGLSLSVASLSLLGEIAEKGINIRKFHFAGSIEGIEKGILPQVEIEGILLGKPFNIKINVTDDELKAPSKLIAKMVKAINKEEEEKEEESSSENQLIPVSNEIKEQG